MGPIDTQRVPRTTDDRKIEKPALRRYGSLPLLQVVKSCTRWLLIREDTKHEQTYVQTGNDDHESALDRNFLAIVSYAARRVSNSPLLDRDSILSLGQTAP